MFLYRKDPIVPVEVDSPDPAYAELLLRQLGGARGELTAALQYWVQSFHCENAMIRDMLRDIALEEFSHFEVLAQLIEQHTRDIEKPKAALYRSRLFALHGKGAHLVDDKGASWTAAYINESNDILRDLRLDIAAETGAKQNFEMLLGSTEDEGTKRVLHYLLNREIVHISIFLKALDYLETLFGPFLDLQNLELQNLSPETNGHACYHLASDGLPKAGPWRHELDLVFRDDSARHRNTTEGPPGDYKKIA